MCFIIKFFYKSCARWLSENKILLYLINIIKIICLSINVKLVPIFRFNRRIKIINLFNIIILEIRGQRYFKIYKIIKIKFRYNELCIIYKTNIYFFNIIN